MKDVKSPYENYSPPSWLQRYWVEVAIIVGGLIVINLIFIANVYRETDSINPTAAGLLGDFVGGYIGTIFSLTSVVLLYATLKNQRQTSTIEKFETKYFELVRLHRENVDETSIGADEGRKIFVILIREFRSILTIVKGLSTDRQLNLPLNQILVISYYVLFYGVGPNSSRMLKESLTDFDPIFVNELDSHFNNPEIKRKAKEEKKLKYTPFEGHQSRLGHYYRHLYQTVCYVDNQSIDIDKYEYVKTLRAQLTTHEQGLLLINSLTPVGRKWWEQDLITRYKLVQNLPRAFFDKNSEIDPESMFPADYFEWQETRAISNQGAAGRC